MSKSAKSGSRGTAAKDSRSRHANLPAKAKAQSRAQPKASPTTPFTPAESDEALLKLCVGTWIRMAKCYGILLRRFRRFEHSPELSMAQFDVLAQLLRHPEGMTSGALAEALLVTAGNLTGLADRMQSAGLVQRRSDDHDRRVRTIELTPEGKRLAIEEVRRHERKIARSLAPLGQARIQRLHRELEYLRTWLEANEGDPT